MFFVNKSNNEEVIEVIYSGTGFCIIIDQMQTLLSSDKNPNGRILKYGKKELKRHYKKIKDNHKFIKMDPLTDTMKEQIISTFDTDKIGILEYTEDYVDGRKEMDRKEEMEKQSEADRVRMLKELADDYDPNK